MDKPRIYLRPGTVELLSGPDADNVANLHVHPDDEHTVAFEPAVAKCATCEYFDPKRVVTVNKAYCTILETYTAHAVPVPPDGSGYCHLHSERSAK